jgi:hypothetical protein
VKLLFVWFDFPLDDDADFRVYTSLTDMLAGTAREAKEAVDRGVAPALAYSPALVKLVEIPKHRIPQIWQGRVSSSGLQQLGELIGMAEPHVNTDGPSDLCVFSSAQGLALQAA